MKLQAIILSLIILVSFLIGPARNIISIEAQPAVNNQATTVNTSTPSFFEDLSSVLEGKTVIAGQGLIGGINENLTAIGQGINALKQNLSASANDFFSRPDSENNPDNPSQSINQTALISVSEIKAPVPICNFEQSAFNSKAILVKYLDYNFNIFELNPGKRWPIASLSKLMTALVGLEKIGWEKEVIMSEEAVASEGTAGDFKAGEVFSVGDLIKAMLVASSNDAAMAIAETIGEKDFINEMQRKAAELKMFQTSYLEPTGLSFVNQSTITDLAKLVNYIYQKHPEILEISRQKQVEIIELKSKKPRKILTINKFAGEPDFLGGKTGYIEEAGRNLIALFNINAKTVLIITLGANDSFEETEKLKSFAQNCQVK